jgi:kinesin family protein 6/9
MNGVPQQHNNRGIIPRAITHIFDALGDRSDVETTVRVSYLEIYNERFCDLLNEKKELAGMGVSTEKGTGNVTLDGLTKPAVENEEQALQFLFAGEESRTISSHVLNNNSTRAHCIFTIYVEQRSRVESSEKVIRSKLNLVDLAGSERVGKTGSTGKTLTEAQYINTSLSFLEQVVLALAKKQTGDKHVPFRQSKLTNFLRDSLGGNCMTRMVANIRCDKKHLEETKATLDFAARMMRVSNEAVINVDEDPFEQINRLQQEVKNLKAELSFQDTLQDRTGGIYEPFTKEQTTELRGNMTKFIRGELPAMEVRSLLQVRETFTEFKNKVLDLEGQLLEKSRLAVPLTQSTSEQRAIGGANQNRADTAPDGTVGDIDDDGGFSLGVAADSEGPLEGLTQAMSPGTAQSRREAHTAVKEKSTRRGGAEDVAPIESEAFEGYKSNQGIDLNNTYESAKMELTASKEKLKKVSQDVNRCNKAIRDQTEQIAQKRSGYSASNEGDVIDEEEYSLLQTLKATKRNYAQQFNARKAVATEVSLLKNKAEVAKIGLCNAFLTWYSGLYGDTIQAPISGEQGDDQLDDGEQFEILERQRVMESDPNSIAFYNAKKALQVQKKKRTMQR